MILLVPAESSAVSSGRRSSRSRKVKKDRSQSHHLRGPVAVGPEEQGMASLVEAKVGRYRVKDRNVVLLHGSEEVPESRVAHRILARAPEHRLGRGGEENQTNPPLTQLPIEFEDRRHGMEGAGLRARRRTI